MLETAKTAELELIAAGYNSDVELAFLAAVKTQVFGLGLDGEVVLEWSKIAAPASKGNVAIIVGANIEAQQ